MKKLLLVCLVAFLSSNLYSQVLWSDNFEDYSTGDFTDQGGWMRDGGDDDWVKIVELSPEKGKSIQINTTETNDSGIFVTHENNWETRESGKNIFLADYDFYSGEPVEGLGMVVISNEDYDIIMEVGFDFDANSIYISTNMMDEDLVTDVQPNTWYHITTTYNSETGEVKARVNNETVVAGNADTDLVPVYFDFTSFMASQIAIDNVTVTATDQDALAVTELGNLKSDVRIYPNPTSDFVHIQTNKEIKTSTLYDINGKVVKSSQKENKMNVQNLNSGTYLLKINFNDGTSSTQKVLKK